MKAKLRTSAEGAHFTARMSKAKGRDKHSGEDLTEMMASVTIKEGDTEFDRIQSILKSPKKSLTAQELTVKNHWNRLRVGGFFLYIYVLFATLLVCILGMYTQLRGDFTSDRRR